MLHGGYPNPNSRGVVIERFVGWATVTNVQWRYFLRPPGHTMLHMLLLSGGAGGGNGFTRAAAAAGGGGGSGGGSGQTSVLIPWSLLPDRLYVQAGAGGAPGAAGVLSYVAIAPDTTASNVVAVSGNAAPTAGGNGTGAAAGAAGVAGTIATLANMPLAAAGVFQLLAGQAGVAGGAQTGAIGVAITIPTTGLRCMAGSGGAGTTSADFAGGVVTAITNSYLSECRPAGAAAGSFRGSGGHPLFTTSNSLLFAFGGLGGSSSNTSTGGDGGAGSFGCGGGGGGAGTTGGTGGPGGPGLVQLTSW